MTTHNGTRLVADRKAIIDALKRQGECNRRQLVHALGKATFSPYHHAALKSLSDDGLIITRTEGQHRKHLYRLSTTNPFHVQGFYRRYITGQRDALVTVACPECGKRSRARRAPKAIGGMELSCRFCGALLRIASDWLWQCECDRCSPT